MNKTQIICTIGPACAKPSMLQDMMLAGMAVARLNFSHGIYDEHQKYFTNLRKISKKLKKDLQIMQDLQGPKVRIKKLAKPLKIKKGGQYILSTDFDLDNDAAKFIRIGHRILIEDGILELKVVAKKSGKFVVESLVDGIIQSHKGVNLPDSKVKLACLTKKDIEDLKFGATLGFDYVALSFATSQKDVMDLKKQIKKYYKEKMAPKVVVKIERGAAVDHIRSICDVADMIMIARGDLGVEVAQEKVPIIKKDIIEVCREKNIPVVVATQMLDSMIRNARPTRAEIDDVAQAVFDGADYTMLSGETAFGAYPLKAVEVMSKTIKAAEKSKYNK